MKVFKMWVAETKILILIIFCMLSASQLPDLNHQLPLLPLNREFPVLATNFESQSKCDSVIRCIYKQVLNKVGSKECSFSIIVSRYWSEDFSCVAHSAFSYNMPVTTSNEAKVKVPLPSIYQLRYSKFCRIVFGQHSQYVNLPDSHKLFSEPEVFRSYHILWKPNQTLDIEKDSKLVFQRLRYLFSLSPQRSQITKNSSQRLSKCFDFLSVKFNWNLQPLKMSIDPGASFVMSHYKQSGKWINYFIAAFHSTSLKLNSTYEPLIIYKLPQSHILVNGTWDPYVELLIERKAHFSSIREPHYDPEKFVYYTISSFFDSIVFLTAVPRDLGSSAAAIFTSDIILLGVIAAALALATFGAFFVLLLESVFLTVLEDALYFSWKEMVLLFITTFLDTLKTIFEQPVRTYGSRTLKVVRPHGILFVIWLFSVMMLNSRYKSSFVSIIVSPKFEFIPKTFKELVESSFKMKGIFFPGNNEMRFASVKNYVNEGVLERVQNCDDFMDPKCCYQSILRWDSVCIGHSMIIEDKAFGCLIDVHGNKLFTTSTDGKFPVMASNAVSKYFPEVLETLNFVLRSQQESGRVDYYVKLRQRVVANGGQQFAKSFNASSEFYQAYAGFAFQNKTGNKIIKFILYLFVIPSVASLLLFVAEKFIFTASVQKLLTPTTSVIDFNYIS